MRIYCFGINLAWKVFAVFAVRPCGSAVLVVNSLGADVGIGIVP